MNKRPAATIIPVGNAARGRFVVAQDWLGNMAEAAGIAILCLLGAVAM